ncbi:MAG: Fic family protein [Bacteroidia bacterium]|nr:Fic family protein [Bacteroidia bacterium]
MGRYIYQKEEWPHFTWNAEEIFQRLGDVRNQQGRLVGKMEGLGFNLKSEAMLGTTTLDAIKTAEIEGEKLDMDQVRSSVARRLGLPMGGLIKSSRDVDGLVEMLLDASVNHAAPLTKERLFAWHKGLFPFGKSGNYTIFTGGWRQPGLGPMQVVSGAMGKEKVHFEAPDESVLEAEMERFLKWFNGKQALDPVIKAAIAHLWFITIHPFEDGNGRIARAIADMQLARADESNQRFYSMSAEIHAQRKGYYEILEYTQKRNLNVTKWVDWFLKCLESAIRESSSRLSGVLAKAEFWEFHRTTIFNERQHKILNMVMGDFVGKLQNNKWAKICKCSSDTALRDIQDLMEKGVLEKEPGGGRNTSYRLIFPQTPRSGNPLPVGGLV